MKTSSKAISAATEALKPTNSYWATFAYGSLRGRTSRALCNSAIGRPIPRALGLLLIAARCASSEPPPAGQDAGPSGHDATASVDSGQALTPGDAGSRDSGTLRDTCNPLAQTGCSDPSRPKCVIEQSNPDAGIGAHCIADDPAIDKNLDAICAGTDCKPGLACVSTATAPECKQICDPKTSAGCSSLGAGLGCENPLLDSNFAVCVPLPPACDAYTQAPCTSGQSCQFYFHLNGSFDLRCGPSGAGTEGATCARDSDCARGLVCLSESGGASSCRKICQANSDCSSAAPMCNGTVGGVSLKYCSN
jgi:hypothetical protein